MNRRNRRRFGRDQKIRLLEKILCVSVALLCVLLGGLLESYIQNKKAAKEAEEIVADASDRENEAESSDGELSEAWSEDGQEELEQVEQEEPEQVEQEEAVNQETEKEDLETEENLTGKEDTGSEEVEAILAKMSLHDKISQMFFVQPEILTGVSQVIQSGDATRTALQNYPVGGIMYSTPNLQSVEQTKEMISNVQIFSQDITGLPLFIAVDEEGGDVARCAKALGTQLFSPMYSYRDKGAGVARKNASAIASDISALGFNLDFAPVADIWSNPNNKVIGTTPYSDDFKEGAKLVGEAVKGFHDGKVLCTLKHFPGHGNTAEDSHSGSAYSGKTLKELQKEEFLPFKKGIKAGADFVMVGHITLTQIDSRPATFSYEITTEMLRNQLGFQGIIITDSLGMGAATQMYSTSGEMAVQAILAGNDMLLGIKDLDQAVTAVEKAVETGEITEERINESVRRILKVKIEKI